MATFIHIINVRFFHSEDISNFTATSKARAIEVATAYLHNLLSVYDDAPEGFEDMCNYCIDIGLLQVTYEVCFLHQEQAEVA